jgi:hypothetical protein
VQSLDAFEDSRAIVGDYDFSFGSLDLKTVRPIRRHVSSKTYHLIHASGTQRCSHCITDSCTTIRRILDLICEVHTLCGDHVRQTQLHRFTLGEQGQERLILGQLYHTLSLKAAFEPVASGACLEAIGKEMGKEKSGKSDLGRLQRRV